CWSCRGSSESSEEVGVLQKVHRNLKDWISLRPINIQIAVAFSYRHPSDVRQDLIISTSGWCHSRFGQLLSQWRLTHGREDKFNDHTTETKSQLSSSTRQNAGVKAY
ncbi:hypothetical protein Tco_1290338, partial [Tanacetum coccineum]